MRFLLIQEGNVQPICDTYNLCQSFCNALKLEVLILQAKELAKGTTLGHLRISIYFRVLLSFIDNALPPQDIGRDIWRWISQGQVS